MKFAIGDTVVVKLSNFSLVGSSQQDYIKECYLGTPLTGKVVYIKEDKDRLGIQFDYRIYLDSFKYSKGVKGMNNAYGRGAKGYCAYVDAKYVDKAGSNFDFAKELADLPYKICVDPYNHNAGSVGVVEVKTRQQGFDIDAYSKQLALYRSRGQLNEAANFKASHFADIYGMSAQKQAEQFGTKIHEEISNSLIGGILIKPRRAGQSWLANETEKFLEMYEKHGLMFFESDYNGSEVTVMNNCFYEEREYLSMQRIHELCEQSSQKPEGRTLHSWLGLNQESNRYKDVWMGNGYFKPAWPMDYGQSDAAMAMGFALMAESMQFKPYGDEEVLLCPL